MLVSRFSATAGGPPIWPRAFDAANKASSKTGYKNFIFSIILLPIAIYASAVSKFANLNNKALRYPQRGSSCMNFETNKEVLDWYEGQERALTPEFIAAVPWDKVKDTPFDEKFVPVLYYMRDVETLTDMYHRELKRTPTGKDPHISKFMERWGVEEITHGEMMNRFLNELGYESD